MTPFTLARALGDYAGRLRTLHAQRRTERALNTLPADIRKDIGWPDRFDELGPCRR